MLPRSRVLVRSWPASLVVVASLALGVGAVASVWATAASLLWAPPPYPAPDRLLVLRETSPDGQPMGTALANVLDLAEAETLAETAAYRPRSFGIRREGEKTRVVQVGQVTEAFFRTVGVAPARGRDFEGEEEPSAIIVAEGLGRPGDVLLLNEEPRTVVGVLPLSFRFTMRGGVRPVAFIPLSHADYGSNRAVRSLEALARLAPGASAVDAEAELETIAARLGSSFPETNAGFGVSVAPLSDALTASNRPPVELLGASALSLLLIVVVNLTNLFLARRAARADELSLRRALGARGVDLFSLLFTENAVLGLLGAGAGLLLAGRLLELVPELVLHLGGGTVDPPTLGLDAAALAFGLGLVLAAVFALPSAPAPRSRASLLVAQVALGALLLQSTVLLGRSFLRLSAVHPGFETEHVLTFGLGLPEAVYDTNDEMLGFHRRLLAELETIPGVASAGAAAGGLLAGRIRHEASFRREGASEPRRHWPRVSARVATPGYFESLGVPILRGRALAWTDDAGHPGVVLVNRTFETTFFEEGDGALGRRIELSWREGALFEIVGVVADTRQIDLATEAVPEVVMSMSQLPTEYGIYTLRVEGRGRSEADRVARAARDAVSRLDGRLQAVEVRQADAWVEDSLSRERLSLALVATSSASSLALAALGIHGLVLSGVSSRRRETAIRLALGAERSAIRKQVAREGLRLIAAGALLGAVAFAVAVPWLRSRLYAVEPFDPSSFGATLALLVAVGLLACASPASRAARTPIGEALRGE